MKLCSNRPEGFGPKSALSSPIPTTCFTDTVLLSIPIWLALILLPILFVLSIHHRKANYNPNTAHLRARRKRNCLFTTTTALYYLLILAQVLMQTLEIVRLELIHFGIALLPFVYVGLLLAAYLHYSEGIGGRVRGWQAVNAVVWVGSVVMTAVKVVGLSNQGVDARAGSKYPMSDQIIDVAVMAGVYGALALLEVGLGFWKAAWRDVGAETGIGTRMEGSEERVVGEMGMWDASRI